MAGSAKYVTLSRGVDHRVLFGIVDEARRLKLGGLAQPAGSTAPPILRDQTSFG